MANSKYSKGSYIQIANLFIDFCKEQGSYDKERDEMETIIHDLISKFVTIFKLDNMRFDEDRFLNYIWEKLRKDIK